MSENMIIAFIGAVGICLGSFITLLGGMWQSHLQFNREYKRHLKEKREEVYKKACDYLMIQEECIRKNRSKKIWQNLFNDLQADIMLYASENIRDEYYDLGNYITKMYNNRQKQSKKDISNKIANAIMEFTDKLRKELGIPK